VKNSLPVEIVVVLDKSSSMETVRDATINGVNEFLATQRKLPNAFVSLYQFSDTHQTVCEGRPAIDAPFLTRATYHPNGMTALWDAMALAADKMLARIDDDRRCILMVVTDGEENASREFNAMQVRRRLDRLRLRGCEIIFLGSNQDAIIAAKKFNIPMRSAMTYSSNNVGTQSVFTSASIQAFNAGATGQSVNFTDLQRDAAMGNVPDSMSKSQLKRHTAQAKGGTGGN
jgi:hypothetical protein